MGTSHTIAMLGAGRVGTTLGARWAGLGHEVRYGVRSPDDAGRDPLRGHAVVLEPAQAVVGADVVLVALPWAAVPEVLGSLPDLDGAVVLDATNPLAADMRGHARDAEASGGEQVAGLVPTGRVVKACNTVGAQVMADTAGFPLAPTMWLAGEDPDALGVASDLVGELGFDPVVAGGIAAARDLEHLAMVWIRLAHVLGHGPDVSITLQRRGGGDAPPRDT